MAELEKPHLAVIKREIDVLGIKPSSRERSLWLDPDFWWSPESDKVTNNQQNREVINDRLVGVLNRMVVSENPMFKGAALYLERLINSGQLRIRVPEQRLTSKVGHASMETAVVLIEDTAIHEIQADPVCQLQHEDPITTAEGFVHEARHIRTNSRLLELHSDLPLRQAGKMLEKYSSDLENRVREEAAAYEEGVWAYLTQRGLLWPDGDSTSSGAVAITAKYFHLLREPRIGSNWQSFIRKTGLHRG